MIRLAAIALLALAMGSPLAAATAKDIQGRWAVDVDAMWDQIKKQVPAEQQELVKPAVTQGFAAMRVEITADALNMSGGPDGKSERATYKVTKIDGDSISIETTKEGEKPEPSVITVKGKNLHVSMDKQPDMVLVLRPADAEAAPAPAEKK